MRQVVAPIREGEKTTQRLSRRHCRLCHIHQASSGGLCLNRTAHTSTAPQISCVEGNTTRILAHCGPHVRGRRIFKAGRRVVRLRARCHVNGGMTIV
jgi:hypothetical protein